MHVFVLISLHLVKRIKLRLPGSFNSRFPIGSYEHGFLLAVSNPAFLTALMKQGFFLVVLNRGSLLARMKWGFLLAVLNPPIHPFPIPTFKSRLPRWPGWSVASYGLFPIKASYWPFRIKAWDNHFWWSWLLHCCPFLVGTRTVCVVLGVPHAYTSTLKWKWFI